MNHAEPELIAANQLLQLGDYKLYSKFSHGEEYHQKFSFIVKLGRPHIPNATYHSQGNRPSGSGEDF